MITVSKTVTKGNDNQEFLYVNVLNFENKDQQEEVYFLIKDLVEEYNARK